MEQRLEKAYRTKAMDVLGIVIDKGGRYGTYVANANGKLVYKWVKQDEAEKNIQQETEKTRYANEFLENVYCNFGQSYDAGTIGTNFENFKKAYEKLKKNE